MADRWCNGVDESYSSFEELENFAFRHFEFFDSSYLGYLPDTTCTVCHGIVVTSSGHRTLPASCVVVAKVSEVLAKMFRKHDSRRAESR